MSGACNIAILKPFNCFSLFIELSVRILCVVAHHFNENYLTSEFKVLRTFVFSVRGFLSYRSHQFVQLSSTNWHIYHQIVFDVIHTSSTTQGEEVQQQQQYNTNHFFGYDSRTSIGHKVR